MRNNVLSAAAQQMTRNVLGRFRNNPQTFSTGNLYWNRHAGFEVGDPDAWATDFGVKTGTTWNRFATVFATTDGVIYGIEPGGDLYWYKHYGFETGAPKAWANDFGVKEGTTWNRFATVFATSDGVIYGIEPGGDMYWYKHNGFETGDPNNWAYDYGIKVGTGWNRFATVFATSDGVIYGIEPGGDMYWYKHNGFETGDPNAWAYNHGIKVGTTWDRFAMVFATSDGVIYGVEPGGDVYWYKHNGFETGDPNNWVNDFGVKVRTGWDRFAPVFATSDGVIYGIQK
jgi:hypothetical protein